MSKTLEYRNKKYARPFDPSKAMHVTLRSACARGALSMAAPRTRFWLRQYVPSLAKRVGVRLYHFSNNGSHLHCVFRAGSPKSVHRFLRGLCGRIPRVVLGAERGKKKQTPFWEKRPYSRLISWGREFRNVIHYVERNVLESEGTLSYICRSQALSPRAREFIEQSYRMGRFSIASHLEGQLMLF